MKNKLAQINKLGQQIWLDNLSRDLLNSGKLKELISEDKITGVTSNPTIFYKAISGDKSYHDDLIRVKHSDMSLEERYESLVIPDIQEACDIMLETYNSSHKKAGYVSFELAPDLAHDYAKSVENAKRLWHAINRPNLMIKVPATSAGNQVLEELIALGINVNITLLFSIPQVKNTWDAYISGLTKRFQQGLPIANIRAVASFFLSRIDSAIDAKLPEELQGMVAIAVSRYAYSLFQEIFNQESFKKLKEAGGMPQDLLWASTGTKNPKYSDVMYVEELIGPNTVNTVPDATLDAFRDHGKASLTLEQDLANSKKILEEAAKFVNLEAIGEELQVAGLKLFSDSFSQLMELMSMHSC